jgi:hypothetical protein
VIRPERLLSNDLFKIPGLTAKLRDLAAVGLPYNIAGQALLALDVTGGLF